MTNARDEETIRWLFRPLESGAAMLQLLGFGPDVVRSPARLTGLSLEVGLTMVDHTFDRIYSSGAFGLFLVIWNGAYRIQNLKLDAGDLRESVLVLALEEWKWHWGTHIMGFITGQQREIHMMRRFLEVFQELNTSDSFWNIAMSIFYLLFFHTPSKFLSLFPVFSSR